MNAIYIVEENNIVVIKADDIRDVCVRCGYQEPVLSHIIHLGWDTVKDLFLRYDNSSKMGLCDVCYKQDPFYIKQMLNEITSQSQWKQTNITTLILPEKTQTLVVKIPKDKFKETWWPYFVNITEDDLCIV